MNNTLDELDDLLFESKDKNIKQTETIIKKMVKAQNNTQNEEELIRELNIDLLTPNPFQYRLSIEKDIIDLMQSIHEDGLIQPIVVSETDNDRFIVVVGHRRLEACKRLNYKQVKCIVRKRMTSRELRLNVFIENEQRVNPSRIETALSIYHAISSKDIKNANEYAKLVGKDRSYISKLLNLLSLPEEIIIDLKKNESTSDIVALDAIRRVSDKKKAVELYFWFIKEGTRKELLERIKNDNGEKNSSHQKIIAKTTKKDTKITIKQVLTEEEIKKVLDYIESQIVLDIKN